MRQMQTAVPFLILMSMLFTSIVPSSAAAQSPPGAGQQQSVSAVLDSCGAVSTDTRSSGSFDAQAYRMHYAPDGSPRFRKIASPDDGWDPQFGAADGANQHVIGVAVSGSDVYIGGAFTSAGGIAASHIAKWDGSVWSALGSGMNGDVRSIAVIGGIVYAAGMFTTAGGNAIPNIAQWNGSSWSMVGGGVNGNVWMLAVIGSDLYAGGLFSDAGGTPVSNVARWDGSAW